MAFNTGSGFADMARAETQLQAFLSTIIELPEITGHQPFISKKKEAKRKRAEQEQELALLRATPLHELEFGPSLPDKPTPASTTHDALADLEHQMRRALGIDTTTAVVAKPVTPVRAKSKATPDTLFVKPRTEMHIVKRRIEVLLQVARPDGIELPFFHEETQGSEFEAELSAARKARGYGLRVLSTIQITVQEQAYDRWA
jgi:hypothetical protein